jgi:undecaprenyl-diphosphatase
VHGWQAAILGLVEGITEYLPVSSTGHLILASALLGLGGDEASRGALDSFEVVVQGGAILAVLGLYSGRVRSALLGLAGRDPAGLRLVVNLAAAFLPAALVGLVLHDAITAHLFRPVPVLAALFIGGLWMIWLDRRGAGGAGEVDDLSPRQALVIGLFQCVSLWPGTSRSMMTIAAGLLVGLRPRAAAEFSFLLGLPTLGAACLYALAKDLAAASRTGAPNLFELLGPTSTLIGVGVATLSAALAVRWLVGFLGRHGLGAFGWYRVALCGALGAAMWLGWVRIGA